MVYCAFDLLGTLSFILNEWGTLYFRVFELTSLLHFFDAFPLLPDGLLLLPLPDCLPVLLGAFLGLFPFFAMFSPPLIY
jgi:hypothetical protein